MEAANMGLERFAQAQQPVFPDVMAELRAGRKESHWMWFIFPQLRGLGRSTTALYFGIRDIDEARDYLRHPQLGARLHECTELVLGHRELTAHAIFGFPDDLKLCSSMTLFSCASPNPDSVFQKVIDSFYAGNRDQKTLDLLLASKG